MIAADSDSRSSLRTTLRKLEELGIPCALSEDGGALTATLPDKDGAIVNPLNSQPLYGIRFFVEGGGQLHLIAPEILAGLPGLEFSSHSSQESLRDEIAALLEEYAKWATQMRERLQGLGFAVARNDTLTRLHADFDITNLGKVRIEVDREGVRMIDCRPLSGQSPASMGGRPLHLDRFSGASEVGGYLAQLAEQALRERASVDVDRPWRDRVTDWMDRTWYPHHTNNWDDALFRSKIEAYLRPELCALDLGAGAGIVPWMNVRGLVGRVCGVDPSSRVHENPYLDEAKQGFGEEIPYPASHFDLVFSDNVLEHLPDPQKVFEEVHRVLKPGGLFLAKTPNRRHYVATLARMTPHRVHQFVNALRGRAPEDTFPTRYQANTPEAVRALAASSGFRVLECQLIEGRPEYLRISPLAYPFGWLYERAANATPLLARFRCVIIAVLQKRGEADR